MTNKQIEATIKSIKEYLENNRDIDSYIIDYFEDTEYQTSQSNKNNY